MSTMVDHNLESLVTHLKTKNYMLSIKQGTTHLKHE